MTSKSSKRHYNAPMKNVVQENKAPDNGNIISALF